MSLVNVGPCYAMLVDLSIILYSAKYFLCTTIELIYPRGWQLLSGDARRTQHYGVCYCLKAFHMKISCLPPDGVIRGVPFTIKNALVTFKVSRHEQVLSA